MSKPATVETVWLPSDMRSSSPSVVRLVGVAAMVAMFSSKPIRLPFRKQVHFRASRGAHGKGSSREGANELECGEGACGRASEGQDVGGGGQVLMELTKPGQKELLLPGGRGGRGNCAFKTGRNKAPQLAEYGEVGAEMWIELELKLVADVGVVGVPNAGKSTLLSAISAARPEVANYPFTTLLPNLGVVSIGYDVSMVIAGLPGLMEGAPAWGMNSCARDAAVWLSKLWTAHVHKLLKSTKQYGWSYIIQS